MESYRDNVIMIMSIQKYKLFLWAVTIPIMFLWSCIFLSFSTVDFEDNYFELIVWKCHTKKMMIIDYYCYFWFCQFRSSSGRPQNGLHLRINCMKMSYKKIDDYYCYFWFCQFRSSSGRPPNGLHRSGRWCAIDRCAVARLVPGSLPAA